MIKERPRQLELNVVFPTGKDYLHVRDLIYVPEVQSFYTISRLVRQCQD